MFKFGTFFCFVGMACLYVGFGMTFGIQAKSEIIRLTIITLLGAGMVKCWMGVTLWSIALKGNNNG